MKTFILILILGLLICLSIGAYYFYKDNSQSISKMYQGPVPLGYDEEYFRETGITKSLEVKK